jgi:hypothetical protein
MLLAVRSAVRPAVLPFAEAGGDVDEAGHADEADPEHQDPGKVAKLNGGYGREQFEHEELLCKWTIPELRERSK